MTIIKSISFDDDILKRVDTICKNSDLSRSKFIHMLLKKVVPKVERNGVSELYESVPKGPVIHPERY